MGETMRLSELEEMTYETPEHLRAGHIYDIGKLHGLVQALELFTFWMDTVNGGLANLSPRDISFRRSLENAIAIAKEDC